MLNTQTRNDSSKAESAKDETSRIYICGMHNLLLYDVYYYGNCY